VLFSRTLRRIIHSSSIRVVFSLINVYGRGFMVPSAQAVLDPAPHVGRNSMSCVQLLELCIPEQEAPVIDARTAARLALAKAHRNMLLNAASAQRLSGDELSGEDTQAATDADELEARFVTGSGEVKACTTPIPRERSLSPDDSVQHSCTSMSTSRARPSTMSQATTMSLRRDARAEGLDPGWAMDPTSSPSSLYPELVACTTMTFIAARRSWQPREPCGCLRRSPVQPQVRGTHMESARHTHGN